MKPTIKPNQATTIHRDHTVSIWDILSQQWLRLPADQVPAAILATLSQHERDRIGRAAGGSAGLIYGPGIARDGIPA